MSANRWVTEMAKYFDETEFACKHCRRLPENGMHPVLIEKLDELREAIGHPIYVSSGYRCPYHNSVVGGVPNSQHVLGTGADIICNAVTVSKLAEEAEKIGFDGLGIYLYDGFVHVDVRDGGRNPNYYRW